MRDRSAAKQISSRRGVSVHLAMVSTVGVLLLATLASDLGWIALDRSRLQSAADAAALAGASDGTLPRDKEIRYEILPGTWHADRRRFIDAATHPNAIRVTATKSDTTDNGTPLFFPWLFDRMPFASRASAVATAAPRDIALVVDLSGSMNDDTEPCRSMTDELDACDLARRDRRLQQVYDDFGYGEFPGKTEPLGRPFGVADSEYAYAELTCDGGPLTGRNTDTRYRIEQTDNEAVRKRKAYSAIIDLQIARLMPEAKPVPSSVEHFDYWSRYLDFIARRVKVGRRGQGGPPSRRGWLPPDQASNRIDVMNGDTRFDSAEGVSDRFGNTIGYVTYVQFMMDHGRDGRPIAGHYVPLSRYSPHCPWNTEETPAGRFRFPPCSEPMHSARRSLIASLKVIKDRNASVADPGRRDRVSIITFDRLTDGGPRIAQPLTSDYDVAMKICARLQAVGDNGPSSAVESGLLEARVHLRPKREGGQGRRSAEKIVVLLSDGMPNLYSSRRSEIDRFVGDHERRKAGGGEFDSIDFPARNGPLMQFFDMRAAGWRCRAVGLGMRADLDYVGRLTRFATSPSESPFPRTGLSTDGEETRLTTLLEDVLASPRVRIVQ